MEPALKKYIDLNRTFSELSKEGKNDDNEAFFDQIGLGKAIPIHDLIENKRIIILSEAGTGKTTELLECANKLRSEGKFAFFLRLENLNGVFEDAFEVGSEEEFKLFINSDQVGWIFLDSIDEAKLHTQGDFRNAIRKIQRKLSTALDRVHILISGRTTMFKPVSDLGFCNMELCTKIFQGENLPEVSGQSTKVTKETNHETGSTLANNKKSEEHLSEGFNVFKLNDLTIEQIKKFVKAINLDNSEAFIEAIIYNEFLDFARRPQDLVELTSYWTAKGKLNSRVEVMDFNIATKLKELGENRGRNLSLTELINGSQLIAAASIICKQQHIQIEDEGVANGLNPRLLLTQFTNEEITSLLLKPIFDEALYGKVRFHHRSVKEYLCAKWFKVLIENGVSKRLVLNEFFKDQFGEHVVVPSRRPILPWLVLLDQDVCDMALKIAPEIFMEGGDPTKIPLHIKRQILTKICENNFSKLGYQNSFDSDAMKRFAKPELSDIILKYLKNEDSGNELRRILLRLIELGNLDGFIKVCASIALNKSSDDYQRILSIRIINNSNDIITKWHIRNEFLHSGRNIDRGIVSELVDGLEANDECIIWLVKILQRAEKFNENQIDMTDRVIAKYGERLSAHSKILLLQLISRLTELPPFVEHVYIPLSKRNNWLIPAFAEIVLSLINSRNQAIMHSCILSGINRIGFQRDHSYHFQNEIIEQIVKGVNDWSELKFAVYWNAIELMRRHPRGSSNDKVHSLSPTFFGCFSKFTKDDFECLLSEISARSLHADKDIAFDLAFDLFRQRNTVLEDKAKFQFAIKENSDLIDKFERYCNPPAQSEPPEWERWEIDNKKKMRRREVANAKLKKENSKWYSSHLAEIRNSGSNGEVSNALIGLYNSTRESAGSNSKWASTDWETLIEIESQEVAEAYRDALVEFWKHVEPELRSQKAAKNETSYRVILGLSGIGIYANLCENWIEKLSKDEAIKALKFGMCELNGFPFWYDKLVEAFPNEAKEIIIPELEWALSEENRSLVGSYPFHDLLYHGSFMWDLIAPILLNLVGKSKNIPVQELGYIFRVIVESKAVFETEIIKLIKSKVMLNSTKDDNLFWITQLVSFAPEIGIPTFKKAVNLLNDEKDKTAFVAKVISGFPIGRYPEGVSGENYKRPKYLKELYLLSYQYIKVEEDIERAGKGVYSPGLRDYAQDARSAFFDLLLNCSGEEAYKVIKELAIMHPVESNREYMEFRAKKFAESKADIGGMDETEFLRFASLLKISPRNEGELFTLLKIKLEDLKHDFENGDNSPYKLLMNVGVIEEDVRQFISRELRNNSKGEYSVAQEDELADDKRPDIRIYGNGFDTPVTIELKISNKWTGPDLLKHLETQVYGDYLRDRRSNKAVYLLVNSEKKNWQLCEKRANFQQLIEILKRQSETLSKSRDDGQFVEVVGIDLTLRGKYGKSN